MNGAGMHRRVKEKTTALTWGIVLFLLAGTGTEIIKITIFLLLGMQYFNYIPTSCQC